MRDRGNHGVRRGRYATALGLKYDGGVDIGVIVVTRLQASDLPERVNRAPRPSNAQDRRRVCSKRPGSLPYSVLAAYS